MKREYRKWSSPALAREMELLIFGHAGLPVILFPTSCGRFYDYEDRGMVSAVGDKLEHGRLRLICVDSVDRETWYNREIPSHLRVVRHLHYESYIMNEVLPLVREPGRPTHIATAGCSLGGYHALNIALRHPDAFTAVLSMGGCFDMSEFLRGHYDEDCYFNLPLHYMANIEDPWYLDRYRRSSYVLATGVNDPCRKDNEQMARIFHAKQIPCRMDVWGDGAGHDWHSWRRMLQTYA